MQLTKDKVSNFFFVSLSNISIFAIGIIIGFLAPIVLDYSNYAGYRAFHFYFGFLPVLHLGFHDGIYLKYGKFSFDQLKMSNFRSYFMVFIFTQIFFALLLMIINILFLGNSVILFYMSIALILNNINGTFSKLYAVTTKFKMLASINFSIKLVTLITLVIMYVTNYGSYEVLLLSFVLSLLMILILNFIVFRSVFRGVRLPFKESILGFKEIISHGFILVLLFFASTFLLGLDRMFIERGYEDKIFAIYAFSYSIISIFINVINSFKTILYPYIVRESSRLYKKIYETLDGIIYFLFTLSIMFAWVIPIVVNWIVPEYNSSVRYYYILLPVVLFKIQFSIKLWTFFNISRNYLKALIITSCVIGFSSIINFAVYYFQMEIIYFSYGTLVSLFLWVNILELLLFKDYKSNRNKNIIYQLIVIIAIGFLSSHNNNVTVIVLSLAMVLSGYILTQYRGLKLIIQNFKKGRVVT